MAPYKYDAQGYQLRQAFLATGSGEMQGKGWENGQVYFPEPHTDFIFTNVAEQFGFLGASVIISLFFLLIFRMIHIALESNDPFGSYICAGTIGMFTFQVFQKYRDDNRITSHYRDNITSYELRRKFTAYIHDCDWIHFKYSLKNEKLYV